MNYEKLADGANTERNTKYPNLRAPWKPGESGNLSGRPKKQSLMHEELTELANDPKFVKRFIAATAKRALAKGVAGFLTTREILDRVDGPVRQELNISGNLSLEAVLEAHKRIDSLNGDSPELESGIAADESSGALCE